MPNDQVSTARRTQSRTGIALALSGGGYRAMLFHTGALIRLNELGLLRQVTRVSSVSGGSIAAGYLGLIWHKLIWTDKGVASNLGEVYVNGILEFSRRSVDLACGVVGFFTQGALVSRLVTSIYDRHLFKGATLQALPDDAHGPRFIICASNLTTGSLWRFSRPYMADWRIGRVASPTFSLAQAVAASSAFPPVLSPQRLNLQKYALADWPSAPDSTQIRTPVPSFAKSRAVLTDGGVYDNHGLEPVEAWPILFVSDGGAPHSVQGNGYWNWFSQTKRVLEVEDNQVRSLRRRHLIARFQSRRAEGVASGAYWSIGTNPERYAAAGGLSCSAATVTAIALVDTRLRDPGDGTRAALVNWGYAICDKAVRKWYQPALPPATEWPEAGGLDGALTYA